METTKKTLKRQLPGYAVLCFFAAWNVCFYMPMDIYITNATDIGIPIKPLAACLGLVTLGAFVVMFAACALTKGKVNRIIRTVLFGASIAFYIQGNFLAVDMGQLNGQEYSLTTWKVVQSIVVWLGTLVIIFAVLWKLSDEFDGLVLYISAAVLLVQIVALGISAYNSFLNYSAEEREIILHGESVPYCSALNLELYSKNKNLIVIIADEYDSFLFDNTLEQAPDSVSEFDGFTYYTNTTGKYGGAIAWITSGNGTNKRYKDLMFYENAAANFKANFYSEITVPPAHITSKYCDNIGMMRLTMGEYAKCVKSIYRLVFFRCMPEIFKPLFWFDGVNIREGLDEALDKRVKAELGAGLYDYDVQGFYNNLPRKLDKTDEDVFKFIYMYGVHAPRLVTKDLEPSEDPVSPEDAAVAVNKIINEYLRILKENGVYDNCEIIFMADHGLTGHLDKRFPLLMYKPAHQTETGIKISNAPISYDDIFPTLVKLTGGEPQGRTIFDIAENEERVRYFGEDTAEFSGNPKIIYEKYNE